MEEMVIVSDYAGEIFAKKLANRLMCQYVPVEIKYFSDGEPDIELMDNIRNRDAYYICPYFPNPMRRDSEIKFVNSTLRYSSAEKVIDVPTYLGFMKKDWKDRARVPISIREVAVTMEPYADRVVTIDMHSPQIQGMFRIPLDHLDGSVLFADHIRENHELSDIIITSTDIGGAKRAKKLAERVGTREVAIVYKMRDPRTGDVTAEEVIGNVDGKKVIFIDDQAITLDSICEATKLVKEKGAKEVYAYCTHGLMVQKKGITAEKRIADSLVEKLYITDTIPRNDSYFEENLKVGLISCVELFAKALTKIHKGEPLSALFKTT
jgi:ribose-phosphate pyrophosphokinase